MIPNMKYIIFTTLHNLDIHKPFGCTFVLIFFAVQSWVNEWITSKNSKKYVISSILPEKIHIHYPYPFTYMRVIKICIEKFDDSSKIDFVIISYLMCIYLLQVRSNSFKEIGQIHLINFSH